jgi:P-type conjugative transfer protein TrbJ
MNKLSLATMALILLIITLPVRAQFAVIDPANLAQNILTAARTLTQIENQIRQLENDAQMLLNEAKNLKHLDYNSLKRLRTALATTRRLFDEAHGLAYDVERAQRQFADVYPAEYSAATARTKLVTDALERWKNSREALGTTLQVQAQATQNFADDEAILADLVGASQSAEGALQASQATNQLLALQTRQLIQSQQLQIAQNRAEALEHSRAIAAEERSRELRRRFMKPTTTYTPEAVDLFP